MKRLRRAIVGLLLIFCSSSIIGQTINYRTVAFTYNTCNNGRWLGWTDWEESNMLLTIDLDKDIVVVHSPETQVYKIYEFVKSFYDSDGDLNTLFKFIDQDLDRGTLRLMQRASGKSEVYIEFANVKWCYRVVLMN